MAVAGAKGAMTSIKLIACCPSNVSGCSSACPSLCYPTDRQDRQRHTHTHTHMCTRAHVSVCVCTSLTLLPPRPRPPPQPTATVLHPSHPLHVPLHYQPPVPTPTPQLKPPLTFFFPPPHPFIFRPKKRTSTGHFYFSRWSTYTNSGSCVVLSVSLSL